MKASRFIKLVVLGLAICLALGIASSVIAASPLGASPSDPLTVPTNSATIAANTTQWFYFDYAVGSSSGGAPGRPGSSSQAGTKADVTVDANGNKELQFAIYTPTQGKEWITNPSITPVGRGTQFVDSVYEIVTHDLYWSGTFNTSGRYLIALTNYSSLPISYKMTVTGDSVTLYPTTTAAATATATLYVPITVTPVPTTTVQGKIIFETATGGEIYTVNGDGTNLTRITRGIDPSWSPDGKSIVFARWDSPNPALYIANADGTNERIIYSGTRVRSPRWSPDGKYIVFTQDRTKDDNNQVWKLGVVEVATGKLTEPQGSNLVYSPTWGSDSTTIYYTNPSVGIMKTSTLGGAAQVVLGASGYYMDTSANISRPIVAIPQIQSVDVSADGKTITFSQPAHDRWEVSTVKTDGSNEMAVTSPDLILSILFDKVVHNTAPTWSPDGKQIMFLSDRNGKWEFFVADADGLNVRQVLKNVTDSVSVKFTYENERMMDWVK